jgi:hypothetical protein
MMLLVVALLSLAVAVKGAADLDSCTRAYEDTISTQVQDDICNALAAYSDCIALVLSGLLVRDSACSDSRF